MNILVLTLSFGSGHVSAARAVAKEIKRQSPSADVRVVDVLAECHPLFRACYEWPYWLMLRYAPRLWDRLASARIKQKHESTAPDWAFRFGCRKVFLTIEHFQPDLMVAVEVAAGEISAIARRTKITRAPILSVITDFEAEPVWIKPEVATFTVADHHGRSELIEWGAPPDNIFVTGIPIDHSFTVKHDERATRLRHGINDRLPIVLLMGGGMGPTRMDEVARELADAKVGAHLIAIAGKDDRARRRLESLRVKDRMSLRVLGWTDDVPALMQAAAILVTKPGGLTMLEAASCSLPLVLFDPIPGAEFINAKRMVDAGTAVLTRGARETAAQVLSLLLDRKARDAMAVNARRIARPQAREEIAELALQLAASDRPTTARAARRTA